MERDTARSWRIALLVVAIAAVAALSSASTASASVLCKTASNPCTSRYESGTKISLSLPSGSLALATIKSFYFEVACAVNTIEGEVTNAGSLGVNVSGQITKLVFDNCSCLGKGAVMETTEKGSFSIAATSGGSGTLTLEGFAIRDATCSGCTFTGPVAMPLSGGAMASASVNARLTKKYGVYCNEENTWTAEFTVTAPEPLYVETS